MFDWVQNLADGLIYGVFQLEKGGKAGDALNFFVFDSIKIFILLFFITWILFLDNYSYLDQRVLNKQIEELEDNKKYYQESYY